MFVRIVKLSFHEENIPSFLENFESIKNVSVVSWKSFIRVISGQRQQKYLFTYSYWETEEDLENYRNLSFSMKFEFYQKLFNGKPEA
jgi:heme-degrading monooxygenase HmoA